MEVTLVMVLDEMKTEACNLLLGPKSKTFFLPSFRGELYILRVYPLASYSVSGLSSIQWHSGFFQTHDQCDAQLRCATGGRTWFVR